MIATLCKKIRSVKLTRPFIFWGILLTAMIARYAFFGARYFPVVDDNNMYGVFSKYSSSYTLAASKMYTTRPVAALLDAYVFSRFWEHMFALLVIMILLHFFCCVLLWKIFNMNPMKIGYVAVIIFGLLPFGNEATYWISASSRIVVGLFFALLSMYILMLYIHHSENKKQDLGYIIVFFVMNLISYGFYEQIIVVSFFGSLVLFWVNFRRMRNKLIMLVPLINLAFILSFYKYFGSVGNMASRGQLVQKIYSEHIREFFSQIRLQLQNNQIHMYKQGLFEGIRLILENRTFLFLIIAVAVSAMMVYLCRKEKYETGLKVNLIKFIAGVVLILVPFAPFFLLDHILIANRNVFPSVIGIGLVVEACANFISRGKYMAWLRGAVMGVLVLFFLIINAAEINDYRIVHNTDNKIISEFVTNLDQLEGGYSKNSIVVIFDTKNKYIDFISQKIGNCNSNDWAFMGALEAKTGRVPVRYVLPVARNTRVALSEDKLRDAIYLGMNNENITMFPLKGNWDGGGRLELTMPDGDIFGYVEVRSKDDLYFHQK